MAPHDSNGPPQLTGPGIFWVNSGVNEDSGDANSDAGTRLTYDVFVRWYEEVHMPDFIHAMADRPLPAAWRYECSLASWPRPFLAVYKFPDLALTANPEFRSVPLHHSSLPGGGPINRFTSFYARFARHAETWRKCGAKEGRGALMLSEAIEVPEGTADIVTDSVFDINRFHDWYRDTYIHEVAQLPGWIRSTRFAVAMQNELRSTTSSSNPPPAASPSRRPTWLTLHEFDDTNNLDTSRLSSTTTTLLGGHSRSDKTRNMESVVHRIEVLPFRLVRAYGEAGMAYANADAVEL